MVLSMLSACGGPAPTSTTQPTSAPADQPGSAATSAPAAATAAPSTDNGQKVKVVWWHISTADVDKKNWDDMAALYMKDHPNVQIEITVLENEAFKTKLATAMQSGNPPDIFQTWGGGTLQQYAEAGLVQDLTEALKQDGWGDSFQAAPLSIFGSDGKFYGVPWRVGMIGFWYNKDLFQKANIAATPTTWAEFLEVVKQLKAAGITPIALGGKDKWPGAFYWEYLAVRLGGKDAFDKAYSRQGSFSDPVFVDAGKRLKELVDLQPFQEGFLGDGFTESATLSGNGKAAMELMGQWEPGSAADSAEDKDAYYKSLGWFPFPSVEGGKGDASDVLGGGDGFAIGKNAAPEAIEFVRWLTSVENQTKMAAANIAVPPVVKGAETAMTDPLLKQVQQATANAKYFQLYYDQYMPPAVGQTINDATQTIFAGSATPEDAAAQIEATAAQELK
ncbi:extracellular solute-binding protein [Chloroflexia bacterium SDU3-3]|nr:extracellular solute-binding protein [Chloroflexia bacterium SDU3-3]